MLPTDFSAETVARMMRTDPARYSVLIGNLLDGFGADHILWGTDTPVIGPPHWQIEAFQTFGGAFPSQVIRQLVTSVKATFFCSSESVEILTEATEGILRGVGQSADLGNWVGF
jgi:hypothetical protein